MTKIISKEATPIHHFLEVGKRRSYIERMNDFATIFARKYNMVTADSTDNCKVGLYYYRQPFLVMPRIAARQIINRIGLVICVPSYDRPQFFGMITKNILLILYLKYNVSNLLINSILEKFRQLQIKSSYLHCIEKCKSMFNIDLIVN